MSEKKNHFVQLLCSSLLAGGLASISILAPDIAASAKASSQTRKVPDFHSINLNLPASLTAEVGNPGDLVIEADDSVLPQITTEVKNGKLEIRMDKIPQGLKPIAIKVKCANLDELIIAGTASTNIKHISGAQFKLEAKDESITTLHGSVQNFSASLKDASSLHASYLAAQSVTISTTDATNAEVYAAKKLNVTAARASGVTYRGNPKVTKKLSEQGTVKRI